MKVIWVDPSDRNNCRLFLELPFRLYKNIPQWVPPLSMDARKIFNLRNPFYQAGEAGFLLALDVTGQPIGRIAVLNNRNYNSYNHDNAAFFYLFECVNSQSVADSLFKKAIDWAHSRDLSRIIGPKGFTVLDGLGMLVDGFDHRPALGLPYNLPYYPTLIEGSGFTKCDELVSGYLNCQDIVMPDKAQRAAELVQKKRGFKVIQFKNHREFTRLIPRILDLYNSAIEGTSGNTPLSQGDLRSMADQLLWFADPKLVKIIVKDDCLIGFLLAYPDISAALQRCRGQLFPFGWLDILVESKRTKWVNINGAAIVEAYQGLAGTALLFTEMYKSIQAGGFIHAEIVQVGTENDKMQRELISLGIRFYKTHRVYQRAI